MSRFFMGYLILKNFKDQFFLTVTEWIFGLGHYYQGFHKVFVHEKISVGIKNFNQTFYQNSEA